MASEIVLSSPTEALVNEFMARVPVETDWDTVFKQVKTGEITSDGMLQKLRALEPLPALVTFNLEHEVWVLQQKLRLALQHEKGKPFFTVAPCGCGRGFHDVASNDYNPSCLYCQEYGDFFSNVGGRSGRGSIQAAFDVVSRSWGILVYWSSQDDTLMFFATVGFASCREAEIQGLLPWASFFAWRWWGKSSMSCDREDFPWDKLVAEHPNYPISPDEFRNFTRKHLARMIDNEQHVWI